MGSRMREDEKIEREIRRLAKLPENRNCINCNSLGPQYVCTTFWTFVCTNCSGIQREFNHRVKSVSMSKFTIEEVSALQEGGNEKARQVYFKDWDLHRQSYPDTNNILKLRDFIKQVYVDRKFTGEMTQSNLPRLRLNDKEESKDSRKLSFSRTERHEDRNDLHSTSSKNEGKSKTVKFYYDDRRSPRYVPKNNGNHRRNPVKFEVVDDRFRDNEFRARRLSSLESKEAAITSDVQNNVNGEKKDAPESAEGSIKEIPSEQTNAETQVSSTVKSQVSDTATTPEAQSSSQSNDKSNWAAFEKSTANEASQTPNTNTSACSPTETKPKPLDAVEFLLSELSGSFYATASSTSDVHTADNDTSTAIVEDISVDEELAPPTPEDQISPSPIVGASSMTSISDSDLTQPSTACSPVTQPMTPSSVRDVPSLNEPGVSPKVKDLSNCQMEQSLQAAPEADPEAQELPDSLIELSLHEAAPDAQELSNSPMEQSLQAAPEASQETSSDVRSQPKITETKSIERKELPENLFTTRYLPIPVQQAGWQNFRPHYMGYGMQYYSNAAPISAFPTAAKSTNPFDITEGRPQVHASPFPIMANLHGAQTAMPSGGGSMRAPSFGNFGSMVPQPPNYASSMPPHSSPFTPGFPSGAHHEPVNSNMQAPSRPQSAGSFNGETTFQHSAGEYMAPGYTLNSFPKTRGGNPFE